MGSKDLIAQLSNSFRDSIETDIQALNRARGRRLMIGQSFQPTVNFVFDLIEELSQVDESVFIEHDGNTATINGALIVNYFFGRRDERFTLNFRVFENAIEIDDQRFPAGTQD